MLKGMKKHESMGSWLAEAGINSNTCDSCEAWHVYELELLGETLQTTIIEEDGSLSLVSVAMVKPGKISMIEVTLSVFEGVNIPRYKISYNGRLEMPYLEASHTLPSCIELNRSSFVGWVSWYLGEVQGFFRELEKDDCFVDENALDEDDED